MPPASFEKLNIDYRTAHSKTKQVTHKGQPSNRLPFFHAYGQKGACIRTGLTKQEKTTEIYFDEKGPLIHIRTHNTDLKNQLLAYSRRYPAICQQTDTDPETGCMEFEIRKGRLSFRLTAPYGEERRRAASEAAKKCGVHRKVAHLYGDRS